MAVSISTEYQIELDKYSTIFENTRMDRISTNGDIADVASDSHTMSNDVYRSFGTYRHNIISGSLSTKINETLHKEDDIIDKFYNNNSLNFIFPGTVASPKYACNANEANLEDIFAEFGYEYVRIKDLILREQYDNENKDSELDDELMPITANSDDSAEVESQASDDTETTDNSITETLEKTEPLYYFDVVKINKKDVYGTYSILPIGSTFINYDEPTVNEKNETIYKEETVLYDATYVPTIDEILSEKLYIVILSGNLKPRKIYISHKYMPSLFINDDKYNGKPDMYIHNGLQLVKLCDIQIHQKLGCFVKWDNLYNINAGGLISDLASKGIDKSNIQLKMFYYATLRVGNESFEEIISLNTNTAASETITISENVTNLLASRIDTYSNIIPIDVLTNETINVKIYVGFAVKINGYSLSPDNSKYDLYWNKIEFTEETQEQPPVTPPETDDVTITINSFSYTATSIGINGTSEALKPQVDAVVSNGDTNNITYHYEIETSETDIDPEYYTLNETTGYLTISENLYTSSVTRKHVTVKCTATYNSTVSDYKNTTVYQEFISPLTITNALNYPVYLWTYPGSPKYITDLNGNHTSINMVMLNNSKWGYAATDDELYENSGYSGTLYITDIENCPDILKLHLFSILITDRVEFGGNNITISSENDGANICIKLDHSDSYLKRDLCNYEPYKTKVVFR